MSGRVSRARKASPPEEPAWQAGTTLRELIGVTDDGRLVLWDTGQVRPIRTFPRSGDFIKGGHYVLDWDGHDITAHCSATLGGQVVVQVMCSNATPAAFPLEYVEKRLRGQLVRDPVVQADILARLQNLRRTVVAQQDTPSRQRGRLSDPPMRLPAPSKQ